MAEWFRRQSKKIKTFDKRDTTEGSWLKCPQCQEVFMGKVVSHGELFFNKDTPMSFYY